MLLIYCIFISLLCVSNNCVRGINLQTEEKTILTDIFKDYDPRIRPAGKNGTGPVIVTVNTFVRSIKNIDDVNMVYDTQLTFRQSWVDDRLKYNNTGIQYVFINDPGMIWTPDLFFSNELSSHVHNTFQPNVLFRIYSDGTVLYSTRVSLHLSCPMDLRNYPLDNQVCSLVAASYGYTTQGIVFQWKDQVPVQVTKNLHLSKFHLVAFYTGYCTSRTNTGEYSCLKMDFHFSRNFFYYLVSVYIPTTFMVLLSWLAFWVNPKFSTVRFGILIVVLISSIPVMTSMINGTPQVSYMKAIDVWIGVCACFIVCCMLELCLVVNTLSKIERSQFHNRLSTEESLLEKKSTSVDDGEKPFQAWRYATTPLIWLNKFSIDTQRIDIFCRFLFPAAFVIFNLIYWLTYTNK